mmetsp:Transcript_3142/g.11361  ORF Transcript_3142/g.11361 Transcript_3142/m.11361 type:complete len:155 (+) Transcript_3142:823-1287(+)
MRVGGVWRDRGVKIETFVTRRRSRTSFGALPDVVDFHSTLLKSIAMHARPYITVAALKLHFKSPSLFAREYHSHHVRFVVSIKIHLLKTQPSSRLSSLMLRVFHRRHALHILFILTLFIHVSLVLALPRQEEGFPPTRVQRNEQVCAKIAITNV